MRLRETVFQENVVEINFTNYNSEAERNYIFWSE